VRKPKNFLSFLESKPQRSNNYKQLGKLAQTGLQD